MQKIIFLLSITFYLPASWSNIAKPNLINIWIHGTMSIVPHIKFFENVTFRIPGLHHAQEYQDIYLAKKIVRWLATTAPTMFPFQTFYIFGWDGKLSIQSRKNAAKELYESIQILQSTYFSQYGCMPTIRLIAHSHGGNVALHLIDYISPEDNFSKVRTISY